MAKLVTSCLYHGDHVGDVVITDHNAAGLEVQPLLRGRSTHHHLVISRVELGHHV